MRTGTPGHLKSFDDIGLRRYFLTFCTKVRRHGEDTLGVAKHILENPVRGGLVQSPQDYECSWSTRYGVQDILDAVSWKGPGSG